MSRHNFFANLLNKINLFINSQLKQKLNKLNFLFEAEKLSIFLSFKRIFLFISATLISFFSYLSIPYFFNNDDLVDKIKNQLSKNISANLEITNDFTYNFFPVPNFSFNETKFYNYEERLADIKKINIYISPKNLFNVDNIKIKKVILNDVNFNINQENYNFFIKLLNNNFFNFKFEINNSNIFYKNSENDVLFINKINQLKYYYDLKDKKNTLVADNEIFNIPYKIELKDDVKEKKIISKINFDFIRLKAINEFSYKDDNKNGLIKFTYLKNKSESIYRIEKNNFNFNYFDNSSNKNFEYEGTINFVPFFSKIFGKTKELNLTKLFNSRAILVQLFKTQLLNNKNLNIDIILKSKQISPYNDLVDLVLNFKIEEGLIDINKTKFSWLNNADFQIFDSLLYVKDNNLVLDGNILINVHEVNQIYKFFKTPRNYRKEIKEIKLNFVYNFDQNISNLNNIEIDGYNNQKVNQILNQIISKDTALQNRLYFKNLINEAIKSYAG